ncbi:Crp/Fnr family transcriptional regulator [Rhizobiaceae bacterium]|nr:Crp/Fnr family transcriptional regulator [Rhizobiaceae bacterium]
MDPLDPGLSKRLSLPAGARLFGPGDACRQFVRVVSGRARVDLLSRSGRPMLLYRIDPSESCTMTTLCLLSGDSYRAEAYAEEPLVLEVMPSSAFRQELDANASFRAQVFGSLGERMAAMMARIDELSSVSVASRLAACLLTRSGDGDKVLATHEALASDCGTSREVVSRKLSIFERDGTVERFRGGLRIVSRSGLRKICEDRD